MHEFTPSKRSEKKKKAEPPVFRLYRGACSEELLIGKLETEMIDSIIPEFKAAILTLTHQPELKGTWVTRAGETWYVQRAT